MLERRMMLKQEMEEEVEVMKVEDRMEEELRKVNGEVAGIPKPSFFLSLVTIHGQAKCPAPKKKAKKAPHFPIFAVSKRRLCLEEEEKVVDMMDLKKLKEDLQEEEMEQLDILLTNLHTSSKM